MEYNKNLSYMEIQEIVQFALIRKQMQKNRGNITQIKTTSVIDFNITSWLFYKLKRTTDGTLIYLFRSATHIFSWMLILWAYSNITCVLTCSLSGSTPRECQARIYMLCLLSVPRNCYLNYPLCASTECVLTGGTVNHSHGMMVATTRSTVTDSGAP